jgi:nitroreductase
MRRLEDMTRTGRLAVLSEHSSQLPAETLRRAAVRATLAPSVHNTQPWQFVIGPGTLEIHADYSRQLRVLDPTGRQLIISCGCALLNARVSLAATGYTAAVRRFHAEGRAALLAELSSSGEEDRTGLAALDPVLGLRRTNRREFAADPVPAELVDLLTAAATREGARLFAVSTAAHRLAVTRLSQHADAVQNADPGYRAELRAWVSEDPHRADGVTTATFPPATQPAADVVMIRDYGDQLNGALPAHSGGNPPTCLLLLGTEDDSPMSWLRAGEALERVWLEVTRAGFAMSLFTQVIEVAGTRGLLRDELGLSMYPHVLLRVGRAPATPLSRRRKLVEVLRQRAELPE